LQALLVKPGRTAPCVAREPSGRPGIGSATGFRADIYGTFTVTVETEPAFAPFTARSGTARQPFDSVGRALQRRGYVMTVDVMVLQSGVAHARSSANPACTLRVDCRGTDLPGYGFDFPCPDPAHGAGAAYGDGGHSPQRRASLSAAFAVSSGLVLGIGSVFTSLLLLAS